MFQIKVPVSKNVPQKCDSGLILGFDILQN